MDVTRTVPPPPPPVPLRHVGSGKKDTPHHCICNRDYFPQASAPPLELCLEVSYRLRWLFLVPAERDRLFWRIRVKGGDIHEFLPTYGIPR